MKIALLFSLFLYTSCTAATETTTRNPDKAYEFDAGIQWLSLDGNVLVRLRTPNIPLYAWDETSASLIATDQPSAVLLNISLTSDHTTLLLQGQSFLPIRYPSIPPLLEAYQIPANGPAVPQGPGGHLLPLRLDYERLVNPRDDKSVEYLNYKPVILLDILGAGTQQVVKILLRDANSFPTLDPPVHSFQIARVWLENRVNTEAGSAVYISRPCSLFSYRCADFRDPPWYRYISSQDFDEHGRIGSFRHLVVQRLSNIYTNVGPTRLILFALIIIGIKVWPFAFRFFRYSKRLRASHIADREETEDWLADEEEGDVLLSEEDMAHREQLLKDSQFPQRIPFPPNSPSGSQNNVEKT